MRARKANESKPTDDVSRGLAMTSKPKRDDGFGMSLGEDLLATQAASGIKVARAWRRLLHGTREPGASMLGGTERQLEAARKEELQGRDREGESAEARHRGGASRSNDEAR